MGKESAWTKVITPLLKTYGGLKKYFGHPKVMAEVYKQLAAGAVGAGAGIGLGAGARTIKDYAQKERKKDINKIIQTLALKELQSETAPDAGKLPEVYETEKTAVAIPGPSTIPSTLAGASGLALISNFLYNQAREAKARKKTQMLAQQIRGLSSEYDRRFKESLLQEFGITPQILREEVKRIKSEKTAARSSLIPLSMLAAGLGLTSFESGARAGREEDPARLKIEAYRKALEKMMRLRNVPVYLGGEVFTPEELAALQALRANARRPKKAAIKKDTIPVKKEEPKISAKPDSPELQELLSSV